LLKWPCNSHTMAPRCRERGPSTPSGQWRGTGTYSDRQLAEFLQTICDLSGKNRTSRYVAPEFRVRCQPGGTRWDPFVFRKKGGPSERSRRIDREMTTIIKHHYLAPALARHISTRMTGPLGWTPKVM